MQMNHYLLIQNTFKYQNNPCEQGSYVQGKQTKRKAKLRGRRLQINDDNCTTRISRGKEEGKC